MANAEKTKAFINDIQAACSAIETEIVTNGVPVDAPVTFAYIARLAALAAAQSVSEFGEQ